VDQQSTIVGFREGCTMTWAIDCPKGDANLSDADKTTLQADFATHMEGQHQWTATQANQYFPLNCYEVPVAV
jgi:hypothetical protein